ncbi:type III pantothenate kinase [Aequorivita echinoideorum]|uniref:Type III pantothenate kinase n=2 Tax=Aequorivita echinoideorum TaxID=1549647 RepID=A0ABS5S2K5_9FLAO|nr:type III pantothenate kinase [Aequorivita echinoideorum]MBT0607423.1 type III pantothenate kinase [Aequorivita echinoideorum]
MNLVIDVGNTLVKLAVFDGKILQQSRKCIKKDFMHTLSEIADSFPNIEYTLVSSVGKLTDFQMGKLKQRFNALSLNHETKVPFINKYATPQTLGVDRIALISAAADTYPRKNVLVIDAGTCITYDFLNAENEYLGGAISPGINIRYKSLHTFTEKLPLLDASSPKTIIGNSTTASIHSGIINSVVYEMDGFISTYRAAYDDLTVILTGGDAHFLRDSLKNDIFANSNFLLEGLNHILEHNKH